MKYISIDSATIAYKIFGKGKIDMVILHGLNSCSAEWWHICEQLSSEYTVLVFDRPGYGTSTSSNLKRTPKNIADELYQLLVKLKTDGQVILVGHSQGGLYAQQFTRLYPNYVKGLILLDPLSANDNRFKEVFTKKELRKSGVDKAGYIRNGLIITKCGLGFLLRPLLKTLPPFYYYNGYSKKAKKYILSALTKTSNYKTAYEEYLIAHDEKEIQHLKVKNNFPNIPLTLITHNSGIMIEEIIYYGNTTKEFAKKVEKTCQDLMKNYLTFTNKATFVQSKKSGHYIHLMDFDILIKSIKKIIINEIC